MAADAVMDALAGEDARFAFFDAIAAGSGLFGGVEMQEVGALPTWGQSGEGLFQRGVLIELVLQFFRDGFGSGFEGGFQSGFFCRDGFLQVVFQDGLGLGDGLHAGEGDEAARLGVLAGLFEDAVRVFEHGALAEHERAVVFEAAEQDDVGTVVGVARLVPLEVFGELGVEQDATQRLELRLPLLGAGDVFIHLGVFAVHGRMKQKEAR